MTRDIYTYADNNPLNEVDPLGLFAGPIDAFDSAGSTNTSPCAPAPLKPETLEERCKDWRTCSIYGDGPPSTLNTGPIDPVVANHPANTFECRLSVLLTIFSPFTLSRLPQGLHRAGAALAAEKSLVATKNAFTITGLFSGVVCLTA